MGINIKLPKDPGQLTQVKNMHFTSLIASSVLLVSVATAASVHEGPKPVVEQPIKPVVEENKENTAPFGDLNGLFEGLFDPKKLDSILGSNDLFKGSNEAKGKFDNLLNELKGEKKEGGLFESLLSQNPDERDAKMAEMFGFSVEQLREERRKTEEMLEKMKKPDGGFDFSSLFGDIFGTVNEDGEHEIEEL